MTPEKSWPPCSAAKRADTAPVAAALRPRTAYRLQRRCRAGEIGGLAADQEGERARRGACGAAGDRRVQRPVARVDGAARRGLRVRDGDGRAVDEQRARTGG